MAMADAWLTADVALSRKIRKNEIDKNMFFDSSALRDKVIKAHREMATSEEHLSYQKENNLTTGNISARYSNNEDG